MRKRRSRSSIIRSLLIIIGVGVATTGISFAALQSPNVTLTGNTINTGNAQLQISNDGLTFSNSSAAGFTFDGVVPGGSAAPANGYTVYLKNNGNISLALKAGVNPLPQNPSNIDYSKTYLVFTRTDITSQPVTVSLKDLVDNYATGPVQLNSTVAAGATATYKIQAMMDSSAYSGTSASISNINLVFLSTGS